MWWNVFEMNAYTKGLEHSTKKAMVALFPCISKNKKKLSV